MAATGSKSSVKKKRPHVEIEYETELEPPLKLKAIN